MLVKSLIKNKFFRKLTYTLGRTRSKSLVNQITQLIKNDETILDIGAGLCNVTELLKEKGFSIVALDIEDLSIVKTIIPTLYNGESIPFKNNSYDVALISTVLHHTKNQIEILKEAKRVTKKIIVIEDIYSGTLHRYITYFIDSLLNLEFLNHPHSNLSDEEWKLLFNKLDLKIISTHYSSSFIFLKHATYLLIK